MEVGNISIVSDEQLSIDHQYCQCSPSHHDQCQHWCHHIEGGTRTHCHRPDISRRFAFKLLIQELLTDKMDWYELVDGATGVNMILLCFNEILRTRHYLSLVQTLETSLIRFHWFQPHSRDSLNYQQTQCL